MSFGYKDLLNTHNFSSEFIEVEDLTVNGYLDITSATISGLPVDDVTIGFSSELFVKNSGIDTNQLANGSVTNDKITSGISALKIADGSVSDTEFQYIGTLTSDAQNQITNNTNNINTNTSNISTNTSNISTLQSDLDGFPDELKNISAFEAQQIQTINSNTISNTQWNYLHNMNQNTTTTSNVTFNNIDSNNLLISFDWKAVSPTSLLYLGSNPVLNNDFPVVIGSPCIYCGCDLLSEGFDHSTNRDKSFEMLMAGRGTTSNESWHMISGYTTTSDKTLRFGDRIISDAESFSSSITPTSATIIDFYPNGSEEMLINNSGVKITNALTVSNIDPISSSININNVIVDDSALQIPDNITVDLINEYSAGSGVTIDGVIIKDSGIKLLSSGGTASDLNHYEEVTHNTNWGTAIAATASNINVTRIGRLVTLTFPTSINETNISASALNAVTVLPSRFRPSASTQQFIVSIINDSALTLGQFIVASDGNMQFTLYDGSVFTNSGNSGFSRFSVSYSI